MTVIIDRAATPHEPGSPRAGLALPPQKPLAGLPEGAWGPRIRNLTCKFPALTKAWDALGGWLTRHTEHRRNRPARSGNGGLEAKAFASRTAAPAPPARRTAGI